MRPKIFSKLIQSLVPVCYLAAVPLVGCGEQKERQTAMEAEMEKSSGFVKVDDIKLRYVIEGKGIPCVVMNVAGTPFHEQTLSNELRQYFKLIFVDLRGGGQSDPGIVEEITLDLLIDDIEQLRHALNLDRIALLGHSHGVLLALEYARKYSQYTSHLILMGLGPKWWGMDDYVKSQKEYWESFASEERKDILKSNLEQITEDKLSKVSPGEAWIIWYVANAPMFWYDPRFDCSYLLKDHVINMDVVNRVFDIVLKDYDATSFLPQIICPVFLAMGRYDFANPPTLWDGEKEKFPDYTYHLFERSGHHPHFEEQELFDKKLIEWIKRH